VKILDKKIIHWDLTTLTLKKVLGSNFNKNKRILEIGTGPYAILAIYLFRKGYRRIVASDIDSNYIRGAIKTAMGNNVNIVMVKSNLFSNIKGIFDIIYFNSVYIPEQTGLDLGLFSIHQAKTHWCGGKSGTVTIENFLKNAFNYLTTGGEIFLGFNPTYVPKQKMYNLCLSYNYTIQNEVKLPFIPSVVFTLLGGQK
jgi:methylase of polypeptide subunit release factors